MNRKPHRLPGKTRIRRSGMMALEVVIQLSVLFLIGLTAYVIGAACCGYLYLVTASMVGSPYL